MHDLEKILERISSSGALAPEDLGKLRALLDSYQWLQGEITRKDASIVRLQKLFFGTPSTEKTSRVLGGSPKQTPQGKDELSEEPPGAASQAGKPSPKGHGRHGAADYVQAERVRVAHETLKPGDPCPEEGCEGSLYRLPAPRVLVCVRGHVPLQATRYEREALRCALCGKVFVAGLPKGVHDCKYDPSAGAMIGLLKYGTGLPFYRLEALQGNAGIPLPAQTQWEVVSAAAKDLLPGYEELVRRAAQGEVLHNDDTTAIILAHLKENKAKKKGERRGTFTSGIVAQTEEGPVALYFTGRAHAGENLSRVLSEREGQRAPPIQMCDGLDRNLPEEPFKTMLANCLTHGRRNFVDVAENFPEECRFVLETLGEVYRFDALARDAEMSPRERLRYHQDKSAPIMERLRLWMGEQIEERKVEPHSGLGEAILYMQKRWEPLTLFLRQPAAPLDNTIVERALKKAVLHRKNALFFKTENGAAAADVFMSLIHTAELCGVNPFDYLTELLRHARHVRDHADRWMPWDYRQTIASIGQAAAG